jgi:hypothetical protein
MIGGMEGAGFGGLFITSMDLTGSSDEQAQQVRDAIRVIFPEAVTLVREAREGLQ